MPSDNFTIPRKLYLRHRLFSSIVIQILFWLFAFELFFVLLYFISHAITSLYQQNVQISINDSLLLGVFAAIIFGFILGLIDYFIEPKLKGKTLLTEILVKSSLQLTAWLILSRVSFLIGTAMDAKIVDSPLLDYTNLFSGYMLIASTIYTAIMISLITFIKQMNNMLGTGVLLPLVLGRFRLPRLEERILLFMDLKDSTTYAEKLDTLKYSRMIQDCFIDVNKVFPEYIAEIYQYVGDEVVLSWKPSDGIRNMNCIKFFFAFQKQLNSRKEYYEKNYGFVPEFKAGANIGIVTVAEVGDIKREIAYHGDTINTASRIEGVCNSYGKSFIISEALKNKFEWNDNLKLDFLDSINLKGKENKVKIYSVSM